MQDKRLLLGAIAVLLLLLIGLGVVLLGGSGKETPSGEGGFGDTSSERGVESTTPRDTATTPENPGEGGDTQAPVAALPLLRRITDTPTAGAVALEVRRLLATTPVVRYVERANGNVFEAPLDTVEKPVALSRKTILRVGEAIWSPTGSTTALRYQNEAGDILFSFLGTLTATTSTSSNAGLHGRPLPNDVRGVVFSPDGASVAYLQPTNSGSTLYVEPISGGARTEVTSFPFRSLTTSWGGTRSIVVHLNPTPAATGVAWLVDPVKRTKQPAIGPAYTLGTTVSPAGDRVLTGLKEREDGFPSLRIVTLKDASLVYLPLYTMREKCAWGESGKYVYCAVPVDSAQSTDAFQEAWRQGRAVSRDMLWRFDTVSGTSERLADPEAEVQRQFDIMDISVTPLEDFLVFRERVSDELWALRLPGNEASSTGGMED